MPFSMFQALKALELVPAIQVAVHRMSIVSQSSDALSKLTVQLVQELAPDKAQVVIRLCTMPQS
jgi:hypothetical protein